ncbi:MAG TPA: hypothetical protein VFE06_15465 [Acidobacteriaceae bacterium]|nr:hypothetical protein [Acidobacteriaceae bacterium]
MTPSPAGSESHENAKDHDAMLDVHPPQHAATTWRDFFIHIATIVLGLVIAIGLEQTVELLHHRHQREQLQADLRSEAEQNLQVIDRDLKMQGLEVWFEEASHGGSVGGKGKVQVSLAPAPCLPGSVGTAEYRYFAPSQAVWTTAREGGLVVLLPVEQARMQARLAHNYELLGAARDLVFNDCQSIVAMRRRFARAGATPGAPELWSMSPEQAERLAATAADTEVAIQGLLFRLRWSKVYEQGIVNGETAADIKMMTIDQERFEDAPPQADPRKR